jgi:hypothetical protein
MNDALHYFLTIIRREFQVRDQYHQLERFLEGAPPEAIKDLELLSRRIKEKIDDLERKGKINSQTISAAIRGGLR